MYNISQQNSIKIIPYFLIYSRITRLSIKEKLLKVNILINRIVILI